MALATAAIVIGGVLAAAGTAFSIIQQQKAAKQQKKAQRAQQRQQDVAARRRRIQAIRERQIRAAQARNTAGALGAIESSGFFGGQSSLSSQLGEGLGFSTEMSGLSKVISVANQKAVDARNLGAIGGAVAGFGARIFGFGLNRGGLAGLGIGPSPTSAPVPSAPIGDFRQNPSFINSNVGGF